MRKLCISVCCIPVSAIVFNLYIKKVVDNQDLTLDMGWLPP